MKYPIGIVIRHIQTDKDGETHYFDYIYDGGESCYYLFAVSEHDLQNSDQMLIGNYYMLQIKIDMTPYDDANCSGGCCQVTDEAIIADIKEKFKIFQLAKIIET